MPKLLRGFTLVELLIVVAIISMLALVGLVSYGVVLQRGRDTKRVADLKIIQSALEQYRADQGMYPTSPLPNPFTVGNKVYLNTIPSEPLSTNPAYCYVPKRITDTCSSIATPVCSGTTCNSYCIYAKLENPPVGAATYSCSSVATYNLAVTPP
jgi:prepilin-type N-terminal cleavage/methylation domain-containing protein